MPSHFYQSNGTVFYKHSVLSSRSYPEHQRNPTQQQNKVKQNRTKMQKEEGEKTHYNHKQLKDRLVFYSFKIIFLSPFN